MTGRSGTDLVVCSLEPWDDVWRRNQYLVAGLLRRDPSWRALFVQPPADPLHAAVSRRRPQWGAGVRPVGTVAGIDAGRLWTYEPTKLLPRSLDRGVDRRLAAAIMRAARRVGMTSPVLWINNPSAAALVARSGWPAIYDVTDDWLSARRSSRQRSRLIADEDLLLDRCAAVTVCSPALAASKGARRPVRLVTNAVDVDRYQRRVPRPADLPPGRVAVYVGTIHGDRIDVDLCCRLAERLRSGAGTLVLVGPVLLGDSEQERLRRAGVTLTGARPFEAVPGYLQHADALVVPHVVDDFTDSLDPIKLYEYRAVGRPVVATPVAGFRERAGNGVVVASGSEFVMAVLERLTGPRLAGGPLPIEADVPTWADRVDQMADVLEAVHAGTA